MNQYAGPPYEPYFHVCRGPSKITTWRVVSLHKSSASFRFGTLSPTLCSLLHLLFSEDVQSVPFRAAAAARPFGRWVSVEKGLLCLAMPFQGAKMLPALVSGYSAGNAIATSAR